MNTSQQFQWRLAKRSRVRLFENLRATGIVSRRIVRGASIRHWAACVGLRAKLVRLPFGKGASMLKNILLVAMTTVFAWTGSVFADTLSGTIHHKDGSKVKKTAKITNSWNSDHAKYTADGEYKIDFKGKVGKKVTIYVNGDKYTEIEVKGDTKLDIKLKK